MATQGKRKALEDVVDGSGESDLDDRSPPQSPAAGPDNMETLGNQIKKLQKMVATQNTTMMTFINTQQRFNSQILLVSQELEIMDGQTTCHSGDLQKSGCTLSNITNIHGQSRQIIDNKQREVNQQDRVKTQSRVSAVGETPAAESTRVERVSSFERHHDLSLSDATFEPNCNQNIGDPDMDWRNVATALSRRAYPVVTVEKPTFRGDGTQFPPVFIKNLEKYFAAVIATGEEKLSIAKTCLIEGATYWVGVYEENWMTYENFKREFLQHFWSTEKQYRARSILTGRRYIPRKTTMAAYFLKQVQNLRIFNPPIPEDALVGEVMRQLPDNVQSIWAAISDISIRNAFEFLEKQQSSVNSTSQNKENSQLSKQKKFLPNFNPSVPPPNSKSPYMYVPQDVQGIKDKVTYSENSIAGKQKGYVPRQ